MRWPSSRSNRAREEMAMTRQFSRFSAIGGCPFREALHEGEVGRHSNTPCLEAAHQRCVAFQLRGVTPALLLEERIDVAAAVPAGLVIHDPAHPVLVHEAAVDHA